MMETCVRTPNTSSFLFLLLFLGLCGGGAGREWGRGYHPIERTKQVLTAIFI